MSEITTTGFVRTRLDERLANLIAAMQAIFGTDIDVSPESLDGQTLGIFSESISNLDQLAEDTYQGFNPQSATGLALSRLVQLNGIRRIAGAYSTITLQATGTQGTVIPVGSLARNPSTNVQFTTLAEATIDSTGLVLIPAQATIMGALVSEAGSVTKIDTPIYGWQAVTNLTDALVGRAEETDEQLRIRRAKSTATPGLSITDAIYGAIANVVGVRYVQVYENDLDIPDPVTGQAPHSVHAIVDGGADADIARVMFDKKTIGTTSLGAVVTSITDNQGALHLVRHDRPVDVNIYVVVNMHQRTGWPVDGVDQIKAAIVAWALANQGIGDELIYSHLYSPINSVPGTSVDSLYIGTTASPAGTANIAIAYDRIARFNLARITVNVT